MSASSNLVILPTPPWYTLQAVFATLSSSSSANSSGARSYLDHDRLDRVSYRKMVDNVIDAGVHGIFPMASSGESVHNAYHVWKEANQLAVEAADGRVPVYCGEASTNSLGNDTASPEIFPCEPNSILVQHNSSPPHRTDISLSSSIFNVLR